MSKFVVFVKGVLVFQVIVNYLKILGVIRLEFKIFLEEVSCVKIRNLCFGKEVIFLKFFYNIFIRVEVFINFCFY